MQLIRNRIVLLKLETTPGTDSVPTVAANAIEASNLKIGLKADVLQRDNLRGNISQITPIIGKRYAEIAFDMELKNGGSVGVAPMLDAVLRACSMAVTTVVNSSVVYKPTSQMILQSTCTIYVYDLDAGSCVLRKFTGCALDWSLKLGAGQVGKLSIKGQGQYVLPTDAAIPSSPTYETTSPPVVQNASFSYNSSGQFVIKEVDIEIANAIALRDDISSPNGLKACIITGRKPKGKFSPEAGQQAAYDLFTDWSSSTPRTLSVQVGSVAGNIIIISAPNVQLTDIQDGSSSGVLTRDTSFELGLSAGDDEVSILFK